MDNMELTYMVMKTSAEHLGDKLKGQCFDSILQEQLIVQLLDL